MSPAFTFSVCVVAFTTSTSWISSTGVVVLSLSVTFSGSFPGWGVVSPATSTLFIIVLSAFSFISFS